MVHPFMAIHPFATMNFRESSDFPLQYVIYISLLTQLKFFPYLPYWSAPYAIQKSQGFCYVQDKSLLVAPFLSISHCDLRINHSFE